MNGSKRLSSVPQLSIAVSWGGGGSKSTGSREKASSSTGSKRDSVEEMGKVEVVNIMSKKFSPTPTILIFLLQILKFLL